MVVYSLNQTHQEVIKQLEIIKFTETPAQKNMGRICEFMNFDLVKNNNDRRWGMFTVGSTELF